MKVRTLLSLLIGLYAAPLVTFAAPQSLKDIIDIFIEIIALAIPVVSLLALVYFFWGLAQLILNAESEEGIKKGKLVMIWGTIALFVMFSVWGLVKILQETFL